MVLAGRGGARMLRVLNVALSRSTVLSQVMRVPLPPLVTPRVLGVDDFALYGGTYGTLLVDATTRLPLTLWEGRDAEMLSRWLQEHPGVEVACRDGSLSYRQCIANGAPQAVQVSDRFHLWQGLSRRVQEVAAAHRGCLPAALAAPDPGGLELREEADAVSNLLVRTQPDAVAGLLRLGQGLREAHQELDPEQLRELSSQQHRLIGALARQSRQLAADAGHPVSEEVQREIEVTLHAVLADPQAAREWSSGRLVKPLTPPVGFTAALSSAPQRAAPAPPSALSSRPAAGQDAVAGRDRSAKEQRREAERQQQVAQARQVVPVVSD